MSIKFTEQEILEYSISTIYSTMTSEMKKTHTKDSTFSMTFTIIMTSIRTVSFSYSQTLFNTYLLIYNDDQKSYIYSFTGLNTELICFK